MQKQRNLCLYVTYNILIDSLIDCLFLQNVIFVDGHSSHIHNLEFLLACQESTKSVKVVVFPSGQTATLQPLDKSVFGGMKKRWRQHIRLLTAGWHDGLPDLDRNSFPFHLVKLFDACRLSDTLRSGFQQTGIYPFSTDIIRTTVPHANQPIAVQPPEFASPKRRIHAALSEIAPSHPDIPLFLAEVDRIGKGLSSAEFAAATYQSALVHKAPLKMPRKTTRSSHPTGAILTGSLHMEYLRQRAETKAREVDEKKAGRKRREVVKSWKNTITSKRGQRDKKASDPDTGGIVNALL